LDEGDRERGKRAVNAIVLAAGGLQRRVRRVGRALQSPSLSRFAQRSGYSNGFGVGAGVGLAWTGIGETAGAEAADALAIVAFASSSTFFSSG
jgi:hypothetical protein